MNQICDASTVPVSQCPACDPRDSSTRTTSFCDTHQIFQPYAVAKCSAEPECFAESAMHESGVVGEWIHDALHIPELSTIIAEYCGDLVSMVFLTSHNRAPALIPLRLCSRHRVMAYVLGGLTKTIMDKQIRTVLRTNTLLAIVCGVLEAMELRYEIAGSAVLHMVSSPTNWTPGDVDVFMLDRVDGTAFRHLALLLFSIPGVRRAKRTVFGYNSNKFHILYAKSNNCMVNLICSRMQTCALSATASFDIQVCQVALRPVNNRIELFCYSPHALLNRQITSAHPEHYSFILAERDLKCEAHRILQRISKYKERGYIATEHTRCLETLLLSFMPPPRNSRCHSHNLRHRIRLRPKRRRICT